MTLALSFVVKLYAAVGVQLVTGGSPWIHYTIYVRHLRYQVQGTPTRLWIHLKSYSLAQYELGLNLMRIDLMLLMGCSRCHRPLKPQPKPSAALRRPALQKRGLRREAFLRYANMCVIMR